MRVMLGTSSGAAGRMRMPSPFAASFMVPRSTSPRMGRSPDHRTGLPVVVALAIDPDGAPYAREMVTGRECSAANGGDSATPSSRSDYSLHLTCNAASLRGVRGWLGPGATCRFMRSETQECVVYSELLSGWWL